MSYMKKILKYILSIVLFIMSVIFMMYVRKLDLISNAILGLIAILVMIVWVVIVLFLLGKPKKRIGKVMQVMVVVFSLMLIVVYIVGIVFIYKTINLFDNNYQMKEEVTNYYLVVLVDSIYEDPADLYGKTLGYLSKTDNKIIDSFKLDMEYIIDSDYNLLKNKLYNNEIESILISDIIKDQYEEVDSEFSIKTRVIKTISSFSKLEDITKKVAITNTPFNILISGIDSYGDINNVSRNDVNIVATVNPNSDEILLTSIPRDYYVQLYGTSGYKDKLTHASYYGMDTVIKTVEDILDIDINYYVKVNFTTVIDLVDELEGIDVYADQNVTLRNCKFSVGYNNVDGKCALLFARERYSYIDGDRHRGRNQQEIIKAIFNKVTSSGTDMIYKYINILDILNGKFVTNLSREEIMNYVKFELNDLNNYTITSIQVDGTGNMLETYSYPTQKLWVMEPDVNTVIKARVTIDNLLKKY